jgi:hypothetical protein
MVGSMNSSNLCSALGNADGVLLEAICPVMARRIHPPTRPPATEEPTSHGGNELALTPTHEPPDSTNEWVRLDVDNGQPGDDLELFPLESIAPIERTIDAERPISAELSGAAESSDHSLPSPAPVAEHASSAATLAAVRSSRKHRRHPSLKSLGVIASGFVLGFASFRFGATRPAPTSQAAGATTGRPSITRDANQLTPSDPAGGGMRLTSASERQGAKVDSTAADPARGVAPPAESTAHSEHASEAERPVARSEPRASPAPTVHFIVDAAEGMLFGAVANRRWLPAGNAAPLIREGMKYRLYRLTGPLDERLGGAARPPPETCSNPTVRIADAPPGDEDVIAVSGDSNALPRAPSVQSTRQPAYRDRVAQWLRARGIADPSVNITQLLRVDLEGDNVDEVLIAANRLRGAGTSAQAGDYAVVLMRKITAGAVQTIPLAEEYYPTGCIADCAPAAYRVAAVLDVSGDGVMEVVLSWRNYEARGKSIYRAEEGGMVRTLAWECAP